MILIARFNSRMISVISLNTDFFIKNKMLNEEKDQRADTKSTNHSQIITADTSFPFSGEN